MKNWKKIDPAGYKSVPKRKRMFFIQRPTPIKNFTNIHQQHFGKQILDPDPDPDQSANLIDWSLAESLSFHIIWFKSVNNF